MAINDKHVIHNAAAKGFQIAGDAYERGRPEYPSEAVEHLARVMELTSESQVIDLGAGTGKFTKLLMPFGSKILAVEPVEGMRRKFSSLLPDIEILEGSAENIPVENKYAHAVVVAQAFHWFDGVRALPEIHRVLKTNGKIGLIWNARDESVDWISKLTQIIDPHEGWAPRYKSGVWRAAFNCTKLFSPLQVKNFKYIQRGNHEMVVDRVASISFISALPMNSKNNVLREVRELLNTHPMTKGKTEIEFPYNTEVFWCSKLEQMIS